MMNDECVRTMYVRCVCDVEGRERMTLRRACCVYLTNFPQVSRSSGSSFCFSSCSGIFSSLWPTPAGMHSVGTLVLRPNWPTSAVLQLGPAAATAPIPLSAGLPSCCVAPSPTPKCVPEPLRSMALGALELAADEEGEAVDEVIVAPRPRAGRAGVL